MQHRDPSGRDHTGRFARTPEGAERDAQAVRLRSRGLTYQQISDALGYGDRSNARRAVERAMLATITEPAAEARALELLRLDALHRAAWAVMTTRHPMVSAGRVVRDHHGRAVDDVGPVLAAIDRLLRIAERRARLLGLDAPLRAELITLDAVDAEIARLTAELNMRPAGDGDDGARPRS